MGRAFALVAATIALAGCAATPGEQSVRPSEPDENRGLENRAAAERFLADALAHREPVARAPVPEGFRLRTISEAGIALALPPRWAALRSHDARQPGILRMFGGLSAELGPAVAALAAPDSPLKLLAFDPRLEDGFATTASVVQTQIESGVPYATWSAEAVAYVRRLPNRRGTVVSHPVGLPFGKALRLDYSKLAGRRLVATVQYVVVSDGQETIVTLTTLPALKQRYEGLFEASLRTLRPT
jgi:hypothetical protein